MDRAERLRACGLLWSVRVGEALPGGHRSAVHEVVAPDGRDAVLKLCATSAAASLEAAALRTWSGAGVAVDLLASDEALGAILLERLRPGTALAPGPESIAVAAELLGTLHGREPGAFPYPTLAGTSDAELLEAREDLTHERRVRGEPDRARAAEEALPAAAALLERLAADSRPTVLLHGDFLTKNVLSAGRGHRVIDPSPRLGDPASDAGMFACDQPAGSILETAEALAESLGLGPDRVVAWTVVWTVLQAAQAWRPDQEGLDALVGSRDLRRILG